MFWFLKRNKKINTEKVTGFDWAIRAIKTYIQLSDWVNAKIAIEEISTKERESYEALIKWYVEEIKDEKEREAAIEKERKRYVKKEKEIEKIKKDYEKKKNSYTKNIEKQLFKVRFKKIQREVNRLIWKKEALEALNLLQNFLNENKDKTEAINFYNAQKKKIQRAIDRMRKQEQDKVKQNTKYEALTLIWDYNAEKEEKKEEQKWSLLSRIKEKFSTQKVIKENIKSKKLLDEIDILLSEDDKIKQDLAKQRLETMHKGLVKEIEMNWMIGYDLYWKILWANKISWDAFWIEETKDKYKFFIWDATWHWIRAGFIITLLNKLFNIHYTKDIEDLAFEINNQLKQDLESRNFVTGIFFEIDKNTNEIKFVWMGHEPVLVYRKKTKTVEKIIPWWLAMWIVAMKDKSLVRAKSIVLEDWDILMVYSDWLIDLKGIDGEFYWIWRVEENFKIISDGEKDVHKIYDFITNDAKLFRWWSQFNDDLSIILLKRVEDNDLIKDWDKYIEKIKIKEWLDNKDVKRLKWKTKKEIIKELEQIKKKKETKTIVWNLETLYYTWEMLKLKEEATRYIKEWFIDKKINHYLKKAMENEMKYKINLKNQKMQAKYNVLNELYKKWDYNTVIKEIQEIISKDWNI